MSVQQIPTIITMSVSANFQLRPVSEHLSPRRSNKNTTSPRSIKTPPLNLLEGEDSTTLRHQQLSVQQSRERRQKPQRNLRQERLDAQRETIGYIDQMSDTIQPESISGYSVESKERNECVVCHMDLGEPAEGEHRLRTNYHDGVQCECRHATVHFSCLHRWLEQQRSDGRTRMQCPACRQVCASLVDRFQLPFSMLSTVCLYGAFINIFSKILLHWSFEAFILFYNLLHLYNVYYSMPKQRRVLRVKHLRKLGLSLTFILCNRLLIMAITSYASKTMNACDLLDTQHYPMSRLNLSRVEQWTSVHRSVYDDVQTGISSARAHHALHCMSMVVSYHLIFEFQIKLYIFMFLQCAMIISQWIFKRSVIKIKYKN